MSGMPSRAPAVPTERDAARTASRTAAESSVPIARRAASTPLKQSPAPVVSTTGTLGARTSSRDPSGRWITAPSGPRVSTTTTPSGTTPSVERSCSLGVTYVASPSRSCAHGCGGAGLRIVVTSWSRAHCIAARTVRSGISRLTSTTCGSSVSSAPTTSLGSSTAFAPGATEIWFSPSTPTAMSATPVGASGVLTTCAIWTPFLLSASRAARPRSSSPTPPSIHTPVQGSPSRWNMRMLRNERARVAATA